MTTIREYCERKAILPFIREFWEKNKGSVPLCCYEMVRTDRGHLIKCTWLNAWYPLEEFAKKCRECQEEIERLMTEGTRCVYTESSEKEGKE